MISVNQYSPYINERDAIGNNIRALRQMFGELGYESHIYRGADEDQSDAKKIEHYGKDNGEDSCLVIHYSLDDPKLELLKSLPGKKILVYHNITPPEFFQKGNPDLAKACIRGREKLETFKNWIH